MNPCTLDHSDPETIPQCLCVRCNPRPTDLMTPAERAAYYAAHPTTDIYRGGNVDARQEAERETRARIAAERKEKRDASRITFLARMEREGKVYDRKAKIWLPGPVRHGGPDGAQPVQTSDAGKQRS